MVAGLTYYQIASFFLIYSFIGWCVEVVYCTVTSGKVVNRGFLNGPVCPIYGFGMVGVLMVFQNLPVKNPEDTDMVVVFFGSLILATLVELIGGWLMLRLFHARWWDYSDRPFNIGGFICPQFSILWGIGGVIVIKMVHPVISKASGTRIPEKYGWILMAIFYLIYLVDLIVTVLTVQGLNRDLEELEKVRLSLRKVSDSLSEGLGTGAIYTDQKITEGKIQATLAKAEMRDSVDAMSSAMSNAVNNAVNSAVNTAKNNAVSNAVSSAVSTARNSAVSNAVSSAVSTAKNSAVSNAVSSAVNSAKSGAVTTAMSNAVSSAVDTAAAGTAAYKAQLEQRAQALRQDILAKTRFGGGRLLKAFPAMKHLDHQEILQELQNSLSQTVMKGREKVSTVVETVKPASTAEKKCESETGKDEGNGK